MLDLESPDNRSREVVDLIRRLNATGEPIILKINGREELVLQDSGLRGRILEIAEQAEQIETVQIALREMRDGKGIPVEELLVNLKSIVDEIRAR